MPILEKVCISLYLGLPFGLIGPYLLPIGLYLVPIGPYLIPIGPYLAPLGPIWPYWALFGPIGPYLALTVKQKRNTEGPHRGHRSSGIQKLQAFLNFTRVLNGTCHQVQ